MQKFNQLVSLLQENLVMSKMVYYEKKYFGNLLNRFW
jgi:hypothetical protein